MTGRRLSDKPSRHSPTARVRVHGRALASKKTRALACPSRVGNGEVKQGAAGLTAVKTLSRSGSQAVYCVHRTDMAWRACPVSSFMTKFGGRIQIQLAVVPGQVATNQRSGVAWSDSGCLCL
jgi:hypothetical protein